MPTIELSNGYAVSANPTSGANYLYSLTRSFPSGPGSDIYSVSLLPVPGGSYTNNFIAIMKGTMPSDFSTLTTATSRSTDVLVSFNKNNMATINTNVNPVIFNTYYVNAAASGTATWFWIAAYNVNSPFTILQQWIGTIGLIGSGSDMEVNTTTVVAGVGWRVSSGLLQLPVSWTY